MTFQCNDQSMLDDWLTVGPASRLASATEARPFQTRLLGAEVSLLRSGGRPVARVDGQDVMVLEAYSYLWVCPSGKPRRTLFAFPEFHEEGRRIIDCDGIGVATSGLRMVENFLDMGHFPYVHANYLGQVPMTEVPEYDVEIDEVNDEIWAKNCRFFQPRTS